SGEASPGAGLPSLSIPRGSSENATCGREHSQQDARLFDHLIGEGEQRGWHSETEYPGGLRVDDQLELAGLHDGQIRRLRAFEYSPGIYAGLAMGVGQTRAVAH